MASKPLFQPSSPDGIICQICRKEIKKKDKHRINANLSGKIRELAKEWKKLKIPGDDRLADFPNIYDRISSLDKGNIHDSCRLDLGTKLIKYSKYKVDEDTGDQPEIAVAGFQETVQDDFSANLSSPKPCTRSHIASPTIKQEDKEKVCFACFKDQTNEGTYRISKEVVAEKLLLAKDIHLNNFNSAYHIAAKRLDIMLKGSAVDVYAADIFYHNRCLQNFSRVPQKSEKDPMLDMVLSHLINYVKVKICHQKNAYLLHDLLRDVISMSEDYNIEPLFTNTKSLKRKLEEIVGVSFHKSSKYVIVYPTDVDPLLYSEAILQGNGLRRDDLMAAFAKMVQRVVKENAETVPLKWPKTPEELISGLHMDRPLSVLYNVIYMTMYTNWTFSVALNKHGFAKTESENLANKIWSIAADWTALITGRKLAKQISLSLLIHRLSPKKEIITLLNKAGHVISYNDLRLQNEHWESLIDTKGDILSGILSGVPTHFTFDNNDLQQETTTGHNTSHHTNFLMFQPSPPLNVDSESSSTRSRLKVSTSDPIKNVDYKVKKPMVGPNLLVSYQDKEPTDLIYQCFAKDVLWSLAGGLPNNEDEDELPLLGSWTAFMKQTCDEVTTESLLKYLPANENPPEYYVCKHYMEFILEVTNCLDLPRVFLHADEQVYARVLHIVWKHKNQFKCIIPLMGGFHQLRNFQALLGKRHGVFGYQEWYSDSGVIAEGSAAHAFQGKHYYRSMRLHKEGFDALSQIRIEMLTDSYNNLNPQLRKHIMHLRLEPSAELVNEILNTDEFKLLLKQFKAADNDRSKMILEYLKDISLMLAILSAVREGKIDRHLQAERQFLKLVFAFDHVNYARYNTYQHVFISNLKNTDDDAYKELQKFGFGCTRTDKSKFATKHGDLETEHFNRETKGTAGPFRSGYSTDIKVVNKWIKTSHIHAKLRNAMKKKFRLFTSSLHKELKPSCKRKHRKNVIALKKQIEDYKVHPFRAGPVINIVTGQEIEKKIVEGLLNAPEKGNKQYQKFVDERIVSGSTSFFSTIKKNNINRGTEIKKKSSKKIDVIIEEKKALGFMVSMCESKEEAFSYPITYYPLNIAYPNGSLFSGEKATYRNYLIENSTDVRGYMNATWIIDAGYAIRQVKVRDRYKEYFEDLLDWMVPEQEFLPSKLVIAVDDYRTESTKDDERSRRRDGKEEGRRVHVTGLDQKMPSNSTKWSEFLTNGGNKNDLMSMFEEFMKTDVAISKCRGLPVVICARTEVYEVGSDDQRLPCNHEEADTKLPLLAYLSNNHVVAVATDCDILVLLIFMYAKKQPSLQWHMRYEKNKFANIADICKRLGPCTSKLLPQFHAITGCDTTSFFFSKGKINPFKRALQLGSIGLLESLGSTVQIQEDSVKDCMELIRTVIFNGTPEETYLDTRIRTYVEQPCQSKTTRRIPPDFESCKQHILRAHHRAYIWNHCDQYIIPNIDACVNGWRSDGKSLYPVWFVGDQYPPVQKRTKKKEKDGYAADEDESVVNPTVKKKKLKTKVSDGRGRKFRRMMNENDQENSKAFLAVPETVEDIEYNSGEDGEDEMGTTVDEVEAPDDSVEWERLSEFDEDITSDSSDSDWI